jgi:hypothetical protein
MRRGLIGAGGVLVLGGVLAGGVPLPLSDFGCAPAFGSPPPMEQIIDVVVACEQVRADRQNLALGMIVLGAAVATGAAVRDRRSPGPGGPEPERDVEGTGDRDRISGQ